MPKRRFTYLLFIIIRSCDSQILLLAGFGLCLAYILEIWKINVLSIEPANWKKFSRLSAKE